MRRPVGAGCDTFPMLDVIKAQEKEPTMKKITTG
jgi:hypothetical protein